MGAKGARSLQGFKSSWALACLWLPCKLQLVPQGYMSQACITLARVGTPGSRCCTLPLHEKGMLFQSATDTKHREQPMSQNLLIKTCLQSDFKYPVHREEQIPPGSEEPGCLTACRCASHPRSGSPRCSAQLHSHAGPALACPCSASPRL